MSVLLYEVLNKLRQIDEKIKDLSNKKKLPPKGLNEALKKLKETEAKLRAKSTETETGSRKTKHVADVLGEETAKLSRAEEKLSSVKNSKEYQAALKEVNQLKKAVSSLNDQHQALNTESDKLMAEMLSIEKELKEAVRSYETLLVQMKDATNQLDSEIKDMQDSRLRVMSDIPDETRSRYIKACDTKNGVGVSLIMSERCGACNMALPKQFCNQVVKADKVYHCPSCQRLIIYINN